MEKIFALIKQMEADGVIGRYAIGGAIGSIFWLEPITTNDIDVFVALPTTPGGTLLTLGPIYEYLLARGFAPSGQFIIIEGWAVGRAKDHDRVSRFVGQSALDTEKFEPILHRHQLLEKWSEFQLRYPQP